MDEQLEDSESGMVADTKIVSQHCELGTSDRSVDTGTAGEKVGESFSELSVGAGPGEEANTSHMRMVDPTVDSFSHVRENLLARNYHLIGYPTPVLGKDMRDRRLYHNKEIDEKEFSHHAVLSFGLANFLSYAAHFCKYEAQNKTEIISIGSENGALDREVTSTNRKHFREEIKITLVDRNPDYELDLRTVDDLIRARPEAVGNCILLIIWPISVDISDGYDIDAVQELQPLAALVLYDLTGVSGSRKLREFLYHKTGEPVKPALGRYHCDELAAELENYAVEKVTGLQDYHRAGGEIGMFGLKLTRLPATRHLCPGLLKLKKL